MFMFGINRETAFKLETQLTKNEWSDRDIFNICMWCHTSAGIVSGKSIIMSGHCHRRQCVHDHANWSSQTLSSVQGFNISPLFPRCIISSRMSTNSVSFPLPDAIMSTVLHATYWRVPNWFHKGHAELSAAVTDLILTLGEGCQSQIFLNATYNGFKYE